MSRDVTHVSQQAKARYPPQGKLNDIWPEGMINTKLMEPRAVLVPVYLFIISLFFCIWISIALGHIFVASIITISVILLTFLGVGISFIGLILSPNAHKIPFAITLTTGGLLTGISLYVLRSLTPLGMAGSFYAIIAITFILGAYVYRKNQHSFLNVMPKSSLLEICTIVIFCLATTFWCLDLFTPFVGGADEISIRVWPDTFYHLSQISIFSIYDKDIPLPDVQFVKSDQGLYHYGSYTVASLFSNLTRSSPIVAYSAVYVPLALILVYLAALGLIQEFFGAWPAFISTTVLATVPDPSFYGLKSPFFGYNWLQQIAPSGAYGVACACVALYFILKGIRENRIQHILVGFIFVVLTVFFKAQIFIPLAMFSVLAPAALYGSFKAPYRLILLAIVTLCIFCAMAISQKIAPIPSLRLDGSALDWYRSILLSFTPDGAFKTRFTAFMGDASASHVWQYSTFAVFVFFSTFGVFGITLFAMPFLSSDRASRSVRFAPLIVVFIYLALASGLALEEGKMGTPEEFLHRHFVWAYFVVTIFSVAAIAQFALRASAINMARIAPVLLGLGVLSLWWPISLGSGIQSTPLPNAPYPTVSICEMEVARFIEENSRDTDILHDTANNVGFRWSGLTGLRAYITDSGGYRMPAGARSTLETLKVLDVASQENLDHLSDQGVDWLISRQTVDGATSQMFQCGTLFVSKL